MVFPPLLLLCKFAQEMIRKLYIGLDGGQFQIFVLRVVKVTGGAQTIDGGAATRRNMIGIRQSPTLFCFKSLSKFCADFFCQLTQGHRLFGWLHGRCFGSLFFCEDDPLLLCMSRQNVQFRFDPFHFCH